MRMDLLQGEVELFSFLRRREEFLEQHYLPCGIEFGQSFSTLGLEQAGNPFSTSFRTRRIDGATSFAVCVPGQEDAALVRVLEQVTLLYWCFVSIFGDAF